MFKQQQQKLTLRITTKKKVVEGCVNIKPEIILRQNLTQHTHTHSYKWASQYIILFLNESVHFHSHDPNSTQNTHECMSVNSTI